MNCCIIEDEHNSISNIHSRFQKKELAPTVFRTEAVRIQKTGYTARSVALNLTPPKLKLLKFDRIFNLELVHPIKNPPAHRKN